MSKGNMLLGHARGKVGSLVFSRSNGKQITRARAEVVKNPQTEAQMIQRIILNTVAQAYSNMSVITDHSFEGVQKGQKSMSYFMQKNMDALRKKIANEIAAGGDLNNVTAFVPVGSNIFAINDFEIAKGTLPQVGIILSGIASTKAAIALSANTYQAVLDQYGLERGDQLTFVTTQGTTPENTKFYFVRVILDPQDANGDPASLNSAFIEDGHINLPNPRNEGEFTALEFSTDKVLFGFSSQVLTGAAVIVSRKNNDGTWKRSNATLTTDDSRLAGLFPSMQECLDMLMTGDVQTLSARYLNNAGTGRVAGNGVNALAATLYNEGTLAKSAEVVNITVDENGYFCFVDLEGNKYYIKGDCMRLTSYGKYAKETGWSSTAPEDVSADNVLGQTTWYDDTAAALKNEPTQWMLSHGYPASYLI